MRELLIGLPPRAKRAIVVGHDFAILCAALLVALVLRFDALVLPSEFDGWATVMLGPVLGIVGLRFAGVYRLIVRDMGGDGLRRLALGLLGSALAWGAICFLLSLNFIALVFVPRSVLVGYLITAFIALATSRALVYLFLTGRTLSVGRLLNLQPVAPRRAALIVGYEQSTPKVARQIAHAGNYRIVGLVHDDATMQYRKVDGYKIYPSEALERVMARNTIDEVFLLSSKFSAPKRIELIKAFGAAGITVKQFPTFSDIESGRVNVSDLRPVNVMQLLGRAPVPPLEDLLNGAVRDKVVMITGAGGSIGSELARMTSGLGPRKIILFEVSETALYAVERELRELEAAFEAGLTGTETDRDGTVYETDLSRAGAQFPEIVALLGSVTNAGDLERAFSCAQVDVIYHAAAYKHVPIVEDNMAVGVHNNSIGTLRLAQAANAAKVDQFIMISTDKAVRPTNIMGASKRLAEIVLQSLALDPGTHTRFSMVRFGNVLGSSGSVVPLFQKQIAAGGPITVTHPDILRYFMSIPEAVQLVIQSGAMAEQGALYVLDMGEQVKIVDLAKAMINLAGLSERTADNPDGDIEIAFVGLRPGEKLYEELLIDGNSEKTRHPSIGRQIEPRPELDTLFRGLEQLEQAFTERDADARVKRLIAELVPDYHAPQHEAAGRVIPFRRAV